MKTAKGAKQTCSRGHVYYKSKDNPVCPICWSGFYKNTALKEKGLSVKKG